MAEIKDLQQPDNPARGLRPMDWRELMRSMRDDLTAGVRVIRVQQVVLDSLIADMDNIKGYWLLRSFSALLRGIADALDVAISQLENVATKALFVEPLMALDAHDEESEPAS